MKWALEPGETLLWEGRPLYRTSIWQLHPREIALVILPLGCGFALGALITDRDLRWLAAVLAVLCLGLAVARVILRAELYAATRYALTNQRALFCVPRLLGRPRVAALTLDKCRLLTIRPSQFETLVLTEDFRPETAFWGLPLPPSREDWAMFKGGRQVIAFAEIEGAANLRDMILALKSRPPGSVPETPRGGQ